MNKNTFLCSVAVSICSTLMIGAHAETNSTDMSSKVSGHDTIRHWQIVEFAGDQQLFYRIASVSTNLSSYTLAFDLVPSKNCEATSATMIVERGPADTPLSGVAIPFKFKVPGQKESIDFARAAAQDGSNFNFFTFGDLTVKKVIQAKDRGSLAVWIPASGGGEVQRSSNIYFALDGFAAALLQAYGSCMDNR